MCHDTTNQVDWFAGLDVDVIDVDGWFFWMRHEQEFRFSSHFGGKSFSSPETLSLRVVVKFCPTVVASSV